MTKIAIFASGTGTNAENIIQYFHNKENISVALVISNKSTAPVIQKAEKWNIPTLTIQKDRLADQSYLLPILTQYEIHYIILAGFLLKIPQYLIAAFPAHIINIHPSLLPKYGGKGMYGHHVHEAVIENKEEESGITIHLVDEHFDNGEHLFQAQCRIDAIDTPESLAQKIHELEQANFPKVIEKFINERKSN